MRRLLLLSTPAIAAVLLAAGCGGESTSSAPTEPPPPPPATQPPSPPPAPKPAKPWRTFKKAELVKLALQPNDAPADMTYLRDESGPMRLEDIYVLPRQVREHRSYGFVALRQAVFGSRDASSDRRVGESIWLFRTRDGARRWLGKAERDAVGLQWVAIAAPRLGEASWAARGIFQAAQGQGITHAFQLGNAVFVVLTYGDRTVPTEDGALAAAKAALARAKRSS